MASNESASEGLRIGNAERERVREVLQRHAADGRLTLDELSDRLGEVYAARTAADLDHALRDLPPLSRTGGDRPGPGRWRTGRPGPNRWRAGRRGPIGPGIVVAVLIGLWAVAAFANGGWFFFPLWPLLFFAFFFASRGWGWGRGRGWGWGACGGPGRDDQRTRRDDEQPVTL